MRILTEMDSYKAKYPLKVGFLKVSNLWLKMMKHKKKKEKRYFMFILNMSIVGKVDNFRYFFLRYECES